MQYLMSEASKLYETSGKKRSRSADWFSIKYLEKLDNSKLCEFCIYRVFLIKTSLLNSVSVNNRWKNQWKKSEKLVKSVGGKIGGKIGGIIGGKSI